MDLDLRLAKIESRLDKLEEFAVETRERLAKIEARLEQMATKADLAELSATLVKWIVGMAVGMSVAAVTVMTFVLNNAVPKAAPAPPPAPIVIQMPPYR
ncbi:MAG TPA: hypothetical protein VF616_12295 [Duganella sp.]|jgi:hypothetical protein|uniref:hypothetical protein n=1 Tax=Duganella sp. TaxID=1904440 RepID=UPI002ECFC2A2